MAGGTGNYRKAVTFMENPLSGKRYKLFLNVLFVIAGAFLSCVPVSERAPVKSNTSSPEDVGGSLSINSPGCQAVALSQGGAYLTGSGIDDKAEMFKDGIMEHFGSKLSGLEIQATSYESLHQDPNTESTQLTQALPAEVSRFQYRIDQIPLCLKEILIHKQGSEYKSFGEFPELNPRDIEEARQVLGGINWDQWIEPEKTSAQICESMKRKGFIVECPDKFNFVNKSRCISVKKIIKKHPDGDEGSSIEVTPYLQSEMTVFEKPYFAIANINGVFADTHGEIVEERFFNVQGTGTIFKKNIDQSFSSAQVNLDGITNTGHLCGPRFVTDSAFSEQFNFRFSPEVYSGPGQPISDFRKFEVTLFHNAQKHSDWIRGLTNSTGWNGDYRGWPGPQIRLFLVTKKGGVDNTAAYHPRGTSGGPTILLGNGDNIQLRNLLLEEEVVSHELSHHIVYKNLTSTANESLDLHEGMADAFVYYRTDNACLAESICPSTRICISSTCLRSGENNYTLQSVENLSSGHKKSQLISGFLWDIGKAIGNNQAGALVLRSVSFLTSRGGYANLISALQSADASLYNGQYYCTAIKPAAINRGFSPLLPKDNCSATDTTNPTENGTF